MASKINRIRISNSPLGTVGMGVLSGIGIAIGFGLVKIIGKSIAMEKIKRGK